MALNVGSKTTDFVLLQKRKLGLFTSSTGDITSVFAPKGESHTPKTVGHHAGGAKYLLAMPGSDEGTQKDRIVSIGNDDTVMVWEVEVNGQDVSLKLQRLFHGFHSVFKPSLVAFRPEAGSKKLQADNFLVFVTDDGALNWWDLDKYTSFSTLLDGLGSITAMDIDSEQDLVAFGTASGEVKVLRLSKLSYIFEGSTGGMVNKVRFAPHFKTANDVDKTSATRWLAVSSSFEWDVKVWQFDTTKRLESSLQEWRFHPGNSKIAEFWPMNEEKVLAVFENGGYQIFNRGASATETDPASETQAVGQYLGSQALIGGGSLRVYRALKSDQLVTGKMSDLGDPQLSSRTFVLGAMPTVGVEANKAWILASKKANLTEFEVDVQPEQPKADAATGTVTVAAAPADMVDELRAAASAAVEKNREKAGKNEEIDEKNAECNHDLQWASVMERPKVFHDPRTSTTEPLGGNNAGGSAPGSGTAPSGPLPSDPQERQNFANRLAHHLSWEVWFTDHKQSIQDAVDVLGGESSGAVEKIPPKGKKGKLPPPKKEVDWKKIFQEKSTDTIAVGVSADGKRILIAGNIKKRDWDLTKTGKKAKNQVPASSGYGFNDGRHVDAIREALKAFPETENMTVTIIGPEIAPQNPQTNAERHAEMQIIRYANDNGLELQSIGISKPACNSCAERLSNGIGSSGYDEGSIWLRNWQDAVKEAKNDVERANALAAAEEEALKNAANSEEGQKAVEKLRKEAAEAKEAAANGTDGGKKVTNWKDPNDPTFGRVKDISSLQDRFETLKPGEAGSQVVRYNKATQSAVFEVLPPHPDEKATFEHGGLLNGQSRNFQHAAIEALKPKITRPIVPPGGKKIAVAKNVIYHRNRPRVQANLGASIESVIDNFDRHPFSYADGTVANADTYTTRTTAGVYAQAALGEAGAGVGPLSVQANGPRVAAGAQAGALSGLAVYAKAEAGWASVDVAGVQAGVGLQFDTGASVGLDGVSAEVLGFGFSIGSELAIETPIVDLRCSIM